MIDMTSYDDYLFKVLPEVNGCPPIVAEDKIRDTIIDLCQTTSLWRAELPTFYIVADTPTYELIVVDGQQVAQINYGSVVDDNGETSDLTAKSEDQLDEYLPPGWRRRTGTPKHVFLLNPVTARFVYMPDQRFAVTLGVTLTPSQDSSEAPTFIFNKYLEVVAAGAKQRLLNMKGRPWYDPAAAMDEEDKFNDMVRTIRINATRSHTRAPQRIKMRPLA